MPLDLDLSKLRFGTELLKRGFAKMQKGGVVMDVTNAEQAAIAEEAGSVAVMALERVPADIRAAGGGARAAGPVPLPGMMGSRAGAGVGKCRIGHPAGGRARGHGRASSCAQRTPGTRPRRGCPSPGRR